MSGDQRGFCYNCQSPQNMINYSVTGSNKNILRGNCQTCNAIILKVIANLGLSH